MESDQQNKEFNLNVLIVDDNKTVRIVLIELLKKYSSKVLFANDGEEAVATLENNPDTELIFMDVYMPGVDGFEATRRIRQVNKDVVIFVMTAAALSELIEEFSGSVINDYFPKPFNKDYLDQLIVKHFRKKKIADS